MREDNTVHTVNKFYEHFMFGGLRSDLDKIGFCNIGYWKGVKDSVELAQINLVETLISFFTKRDGNVLDVACGKGASSKFLTKYFDPQKITGINISEAQLQICKTIAPECNFKLMDATALEFTDASFNNILCIEAAPHFMTRYRFLEEAYRVLTPGGRIAMSDFFVYDYDYILDVIPSDWPKDAWPKENCLPDLDAYRANMRKVGFGHVRVEDITDLSLTAYRKFRIRDAEMTFDERRDYKMLGDLTNVQTRGVLCLAYAIK
jgi:MPBQ/MSBQ methyltransferase